MAKFVGSPITINVAPAAVGGDPALKTAFLAMASGATAKDVMTTTQWPVDGTRLNYFGWNGNAHWDTTTKTIHMLMKSNKTGGDGEAAYAKFTASTNNWTQPWRGNISTVDNSGTLNTGHVYNSYDWSIADQDWYGVSWYNRLQRWNGTATGIFTDLGSLASPAPFVSNATGGNAPWSMAVAPNAYTGSVEGLLLMYRNRIVLTKKDLSGAVQVWAKQSNQSFYYQAILRAGTGRFVFHGGIGYTKTNSTYNNTATRATAEVPFYLLYTNGDGTVSVARIQDAPSAAVGSGSSNHDKVCIYNDFIYLFEGDGTGIWRYDMASVTSPNEWIKLTSTHNFGDGSTKSFILCPIPEYNGIVAMGNNGTATNKVTNQTANMFRYKV